MMKKLFFILLVFLLAGCAYTPKPSPKMTTGEDKKTVQQAPEKKEVQTIAPTQTEEKKKAIEILKEKLRNLEENQARLSEEGKELEEAYAELQETQDEINERQAKLESEQARLQEEQMVEKIIERKQEKPRAVKAEAKKAKPVPAKKPKAKEEDQEIIGNNPYAVHIASRKTLEPARDEMKKLQKEGFLAYLALYDNPKKGKWYRVLVDRFKSKKEADDFASQLRKITGTTYAKALYLPYSIEVNMYNSYEKASKEEGLLLSKDYLAYIIPFQSPTKGISYQLLVGAYQTKREAEIVSKNLERDGYKSRIILP